MMAAADRRVMWKVSWWMVLLWLACSSVSCSRQATREAEAPQEAARDLERGADREEAEAKSTLGPKRVILLIGDGMGVSALSAASYAAGSPLAMLGMEELGYVTTHSHEFVTTDSAAAATALATGKKTHFNGVSVEAGTTAAQEGDESRHLGTAVEAARRAGWKTGLVSTTRVVHATPAAFAAHRAARHSYEGIAADLRGAGVDVLLGAGTRYFEERADGRDLLEEMRRDGYTIARDAVEVRGAAGFAKKLVGLMGDKDLAPAGDPKRAMSLQEMTRHAISVLDRENDAGFFLMVEGSQIDWRAHGLDAEGVIRETMDFDAAVAEALAYAEGRDDTLVVATADHETGGLAVVDARYAEALEGALERARESVGAESREGSVGLAGAAGAEYFELGGFGGPEGWRGETFGPGRASDPRMATTFGHVSTASRGLCGEGDGRFYSMHTPLFVPVLAQGRGAAWVSGATDNAELGRRLNELISKEHSRSARPSSRGVGLGGERAPKNVVLMIGDGMGIGSLTAAHYAHGGLAMREFPVKGMVATHADDALVADSAASATALASGERTGVGAIGVTATDQGMFTPVETVLERAERTGKRTGLISTTTVTHATPAAFYAHHPRRKDEARIAQFLVDLPDRVEGADGVDLVIGGGGALFDEAARRGLSARGGEVIDGWGEGKAMGGKAYYFVRPGPLQPATKRLHDGDSGTPTLAEMVRVGLDQLSAHRGGFFLMVEGGQIDWVQHGMRSGAGLVDEVVDFDQAVAVAREFAERDGETLVVVTADHDHSTSVIDNHYGFQNRCTCAAASECGGPWEIERLEVPIDRIPDAPGFGDTSLQGRHSPPAITVQYGWLAVEGAAVSRLNGPHSANFVPLYAMGPWASKFKGFLDQPEVGGVLMEWAATR